MTFPEFDIDTATDELAARLATTAVERDRSGGHAATERQWIRESGLLALSIPRAHGGLGADWPTIYRVTGRLAAVDSALAHVHAFHHLQMVSVQLFGNAAQQDRLFGETVAGQLFWGNALNPLDTGLVATPVTGGWQLDGIKSYASGSVGADRLCLSAHVPDAEGGPPRMLVGTLSTHAPGVSVQQDWDSFGQRQTDSGTVRFSGVHLAAQDVFLAPGAVQSVRTTLRSQFAQLILAHIFGGLADGALQAARAHTERRARAWPASGVVRPADDPFVQQRFGQMRLLVRPVQLAAADAAQHLQWALDRGDDLTAQERGEVAVAVAEAKVLAHRAALEVTSECFEVTGAASTSQRHGLDRFWRNARVHTLHDPVDYKVRDIGRFTLDGRVPEPSPYA